MKIIENKKLFGKINIIDIIIFLIIALIGIAVIWYFSGKNISKGNYIPTKCYVRLEDMPKNLVKNIQVNDKVYDNETNTYIGKVVYAERKDNVLVKKNLETNEFVSSVNPLVDNIELCIECELKDIVTDLVVSNDYSIKVGKEIYLRGSNFAGKGYISEIER